MSNDINKVLEERGSRYGKFSTHAEISVGMNDIFASGVKKRMYELGVLKEGIEYTDSEWTVIWNTYMPPIMQEAAKMITHKLARIANGDPHYDDSWRDIAGYATLVVNYIEGKEI
ncbi:MAG: DUF6378 domain-containing protein [Prevotella sp.]